MNKVHLAVRNSLKRRKPSFIRQDAHKRKRLGLKWRRPRGIHSKMREQQKGRRVSPRIGFGAPRDVRGLTREGFVPIMVVRPEDLDKVQQPFTIAHTVGLKKRVAIVKIAVEKKLRILNIKDPQAFLSSVEQLMKDRQQKKSSRVSAKKKTQEESKKVAEKQVKKEESVEEKEQREKEEKRKLLEAKA